MSRLHIEEGMIPLPRLVNQLAKQLPPHRVMKPNGNSAALMLHPPPLLRGKKNNFPSLPQREKEAAKTPAPTPTASADDCLSSNFSNLRRAREIPRLRLLVDPVVNPGASQIPLAVLIANVIARLRKISPPC